MGRPTNLANTQLGQWPTPEIFFLASFRCLLAGYALGRKLLGTCVAGSAAHERAKSDTVTGATFEHPFSPAADLSGRLGLERNNLLRLHS